MANDSGRDKVPAYLLWIDLETTGLDPRTDLILEVAAMLAPFDDPFRENGVCEAVLPWRPDYTTVLSVVKHPMSEVEKRLEKEPYVREMHTKSGLLAALTEGQGNHLEDIETELLNMLTDWPTDKSEKVVLAGLTVGAFDLQFVRAQMPRFAEKLSHRAYDVSAIKLQCQSFGMPKIRTEEEKHRAFDDILGAMEHGKLAWRWLREFGWQAWCDRQRYGRAR